MANEKSTKLSIVIRTVDAATAKIKAINDRLDKITKPVRDFKDALSELREKSGFDDVVGGFKGVGSAIAGILGKLAMIGGVIGAAVAGMMSLIDGFDQLGDKAEHIGVGVDFLAQMRYAAKKSGAEVEQLDAGLQGFVTGLGQARAGTGKLAGFLKLVSPELLKQLKGAKSNEEAFGLLADAMAKIQDPAKRAAFAAKTLGDPALAGLLAKGSKGIKELRDRYAELAGSQEGAVGAAGEFGDSMDDLSATTDGIKAALVQGLAPALKVIVDQLREWFAKHRGDVAQWAKDLGEKLPGAVAKLGEKFRWIGDKIKSFTDSGWKLKVAAVALAGVIIGPLISSIVSLGIALLTTPVGWIVGGIAAIATAAYLLIDNWSEVSGFFTDLWDTLGEKFGIARDIVAYILAPFIYVPAKIIANWGRITGFFSSLWDDITSVFAAARDIILGTIDKIVESIDWVIKKIGEFIDGTEEGREKALDAFGLDFGDETRERLIKGGRKNDVSEQAKGAIGATRSTSEAKVTLDIKNAPPGTRVTTDPQSTADVDLSVGYQLLPGIL